jgi:hypothetical protein
VVVQLTGPQRLYVKTRLEGWTSAGVRRKARRFHARWGENPHQWHLRARRYPWPDTELAHK